MNENKYSIGIAAGGTGGHISPAVSILLALLKESSIKQVIFFFFTLDKNKNYPDILKISKLSRVQIIYYPAPKIPKSPKNIISFFKQIYSSIQIVQINNKQIPIKLCIGAGGFPSFPLLLWSFTNNIPYYLCEQNTIIGFSNKLMSLRAKKIFLSFPQKKYHSKEMLTGNPLRYSFWESVPKIQKIQKKITTILILGGSQGASQLNNTYLALTTLPEFQNVSFTISTGSKEYETILKKGRKRDLIIPFIDDVKNALLKHDLIISRAGSSSIFEIVWSQTPAILLPYPYATNQHQKHNANFLKKQKVAEVIDIQTFSKDDIRKEILFIINSDFYQQAQKNYLKQNRCLPIDAHQIISKYIVSTLSNSV